MDTNDIETFVCAKSVFADNNTECSRDENVSTSADKPKLTPDQEKLIERNRQRALLLRQARLTQHPYSKSSDPVKKGITKIHGTKFIDTGGGFLLEESEDQEGKIKLVVKPSPVLHPDQPTCLECQEPFALSYLFEKFDYAVCDSCRDDEDKHALITKTDAKNEYFLKDCDLEKREPPLKFIVRKNPHNVRWGDMKLYLHVQVEQRALEVWGSEEELLKEKDLRDEKRNKSKTKKYNKQMKSLRMSVRSSLYNRTSAAAHEHKFGPDTYNEEDDNYHHTCLTCDYEETFEKM